MQGLTYAKYRSRMKRLEEPVMTKKEFKQFGEIEERQKKRYQQLFGRL